MICKKKPRIHSLFGVLFVSSTILLSFASYADGQQDKSLSLSSDELWHPSCQLYMKEALKGMPRNSKEVEGMRWNTEPVSWRACVEAYQNGASNSDNSYITVKHSGKCLDVSETNLKNGANVHQWECVGVDNQKWDLENAEDGYFQVKARHSGKCLDVSEASLKNGANVHQWECVGVDNQKWKLVDTGDGFFQLKAKHSGKCLEIDREGTSNGANVIQGECRNVDSQKWSLDHTPIPPAPHKDLLYKKLYNFWLGQNVGVWTGLPYEFHYPSKDGFTCSISCNSDLPQVLNEGAIANIKIVNRDSYESDDDTDIEAIYLALVEEKIEGSRNYILSVDDIARGWDKYIHKNDGGSPDSDPNGLWGSNQNFLIEARSLLRSNNGREIFLGDILNSSTYADFQDYIDAQLTTEAFGVMSDSVDTAIRMAHFPIRVVADDEIGSISKFYIALTTKAIIQSSTSLSLAELAEHPEVKGQLTGIPKEIFEFVKYEYNRNPRISFTQMRTIVNNRFKSNFQKTGQPWTDMIKGSVNFAGFVMAMYIGQTEYWDQGELKLKNNIRKTIQYAVGGGNDADNSTATIAGILGALYGEDFQKELFGAVSYNHGYTWSISPDDGQPERPGLSQKALGSIHEFTEKTLKLRKKIKEFSGN